MPTRKIERTIVASLCIGVMNAPQMEKLVQVLSRGAPSNGDTAAFRTEAPKLLDFLFKSEVFASIGDGQPKVGILADKTSSFQNALRDTLKVSSKASTDLWNGHLKAATVQGKEIVNFEILLSARSIFIGRHIAAWDLLSEMLRIDLDPEHPWHGTVSAELDTLLTKNLFGLTLSRLTESLSEWQPWGIDRASFAHLPAHEVSQFIVAVHQQWARDYVEEHCRCLDVLILLSYSRRSLSLSEVTDLLVRFATQSLDVQSNSALQFLLENSSSAEVAAIEGVLQKVTFRYTVLFASSFQFWRCFQADAEAMRQHPLLAPAAPDYSQPASHARDLGSVDSILEMVQNATDVLQKCVSPHVPPLSLRRSESGGSDISASLALTETRRPQSVTPVQRLATGLWLAFLEAFAEHTIVGAEVATTTTFATFRAAAAQWAFVPLLHEVVAAGLSARGAVAQIAVVHASSDAEKKGLSLLSADPSTFIFCSVLQELTNVVIAQHTLREPTALTELGAATSLVEMTYRGQADLASAFWAAWHEVPGRPNDGRGSPFPADASRHAYPLCRLVRILLESAPHDPSFLYRILVALAGSTEARMTLLEVLNEPVSVISQVPQDQLRFRSEAELRFNNPAFNTEQWDSARTWLRENDAAAMPGVRVVKVSSELSAAAGGQERWWARGASAPASHSTTRTPQDGEKGVVLDYDEEREACLVRWDSQRLWWELLIDTLVEFASCTTAPSAEMLGAVEPALKLLVSVLSDHSQAQVAAYFLETKWNEIALLSLLRSAGAAEHFNELSRRNVRLSSLRADSAATVDLLIYDLGMPPYDAEQIVAKLRQATSAEDLLATCTFADVLARVTAQVLRVGLSNASQAASGSGARLAVLGVQLHVVASQVSHSWAIAQSSVVAAAVPLSGRSTSVGGLYEALLSASSQRHLQPVLPEILLLMAMHVRRQASAARSLPGLLLPRVSALFDELSTGRGALTVEDLAVALAGRGVGVSPEQLLEYLLEVGLDGRGAVRYSEFVLLLLDHDVCNPDNLSATRRAPSDGLQELRQSLLEILSALPVPLADQEQQLKMAVICVLNQFNLVYRNTALVGRNIEENAFLLFQTLDAIHAALTSSLELTAFVVENAAGNLAFLQAIVHIALSPALLTLSRHGPAAGTRPATFKDLLAMGSGQEVLARVAGAVLPIDFSTLSGGGDGGSASSAVPVVVATAVELLSTSARRVLLQLMTAQDSADGRSLAEQRLRRSLMALLVEPCALAIIGMPWLTELVSGPTVKAESVFGAGPSALSPAMQGTHVALLCGMLQMPTATADDKVEVLRLLNEIAEAQVAEAEGGRSIAERVGIENEPAFVDILASCLQDGTRTERYFRPTVRGAAIEFLLVLVNQQPTALCSLFSVKKTGTGESVLANALLAVLASAENLFTTDPRGLHLLYDLILALCKAKQYMALVKTALVMIQSKKFWDCVTVPLMLDVPPLPNTAIVVKSFTDRLLHRSGRSAETALEALDHNTVEWRGAVSNNVNLLEEEVAFHSLRLHCHASALALLSVERYGMFYEIDAAVATQVTKKLQAFYVKATESHRFVSWIKHYLLISVDITVQDDMQRIASALQLSLDHLAVGEQASAEYGLNYRYEMGRLDATIVTVHSDVLVQDLAAGEAGKVNLYLLAHLKAVVQRFNLCTSLADSALELVRAWRQFLEFYVLPGSAAKLHQTRERSGSEGGATRSRKHSFDGESIDDGATSVSPHQAGTLSPATSAQSQASPLAAKKSAFAGDKRSYEVVTEIMAQLECHRGDGCMRSVLGRTAIAEKCELLVSMLHHQLRSVTARTSDPSKSVTVSRDLGSMRLTQDKMEKLLEKLDDFYRDLVFAEGPDASSFRGDEGADGELLLQLKSSIALRLLTSMMLLLNSIFAFNSADDVHSKLSHRRRSIYLFAVTALKNLLSACGASVLANSPPVPGAVESSTEESKAGPSSEHTPSAARSNRLSTEQSIAQVCMQILKLALPRHSAVPLISITDHTAWRVMVSDCGAAALLTQIVRQLSIITAAVPSWDHNYSLWRAAALETGSKGGAEVSPVRALPRPVDAATYDEHRCMLMSLLCAMDALTSAISANIISMRSAADIAAVLEALISSPLLRAFQHAVLSQAESLSAALMGYSGVTTETSLVTACWIRAVNLVENIVVRLDEEDVASALKEPTDLRSAGPPVVTALDLSEGVCQFVRTYVDLLLLPMRPAAHRYTVQQLRLMRTAANLFSSLNAKLPAWKVALPAIYAEVSNRTTMLLRVFGLLLWHGEDMETMEQQRRLLAHCTAVSPAEKSEGRVAHSGRKMRRRSGSFGASREQGGRTPDQHVTFGQTTVLGANIMKSDCLPGDTSSDGGTITPIIKSRKPVGYYSSLHAHHAGVSSGAGRGAGSGSDVADGLQDSMLEFLLDVEAHMIAAMAPLATYLRQITPIPLEVASFDEFGRPLYPVGQRVFYISERAGGALLEGVVARSHGGDTYAVVLLDGMVENEVHASQVKFTSAPIVQYQSLSDLAKHSVDDSSITVTLHHGHAEMGNALSTAHLLRSLQLATSAVTGSRLHNQTHYPQAAQDLSVLAGQLAWLVVSNIAHHALAPMGREISMIHQLNDLKRAIRPRERSEASLASMSGSTSPFISYLDRRDRHPGLVTPVGGALTPTSSLSGQTASGFLKWMHSSEWSGYVVFLDRWCEEIFYILGRGATLVTAAEDEVEEESPAARIRKKRVGLRARIEWVQSPEEV